MTLRGALIFGATFLALASACGEDEPLRSSPLAAAGSGAIDSGGGGASTGGSSGSAGSAVDAAADANDAGADSESTTPGPRGRTPKAKRSSVPSWDDIVFGTRPDED